MSAVQDRLRLSLMSYLEEYGDRGYDKEDLVDFIVANVVRANAGDTRALILWYRKRADELEKTTLKSGPPNRTKGTT